MEAKLKESGRQGLPSAKQCRTPFVTNYRAELDTSPELRLEGQVFPRINWDAEMGCGTGTIVYLT